MLAELERGNSDPTLVVGASDRRRTLTEPAFVGRKVELETIDAEVEASRTKQSRLLLLEGASGSGKTRLLAEVARRGVREGMWVLRGVAASDVGRHPFQVFDGIVNEFIAAGRSQPELADSVWRRLGEYRDGVMAAFPILTEELGWQASRNDMPSVFSEMRNVKGLVHFLHALGTARRPAMVVLDDCQWSDELTVKLLELWSATQTDSANAHSHVLLIVSFRSEEVPAHHPLRRIRASTHLRLGPLLPDDIQQLVESMAGPLPSKTTEEVQRLAGGSPFMASAVLRGLVESGAMFPTPHGWNTTPSAFESLQSSSQAGSVLARRIELLPDHTIDVLQVGAVLGKEFDLGAAAMLTSQSPASLLAALDEARQRQLVWVRANGHHCAFVHDRIRNVLLERLTVEQRQQLHLSAAVYLREHEPQRVSDLAYHFDAAGDSIQALSYAIEAAESARAQHALEIADQQYRIAQRGAAGSCRAIQYRIAEGLGEVLMLRGRYDAAESLFEKAARLAEGDFAVAQIRGMLGELASKRGDMGHAVQRAEEALEALGYRIPRKLLTLIVWAAWEVAVQLLHTLLPFLLVHRRKQHATDSQLLAFRLFSRLTHGYWFTRPRLALLWAHFAD